MKLDSSKVAIITGVTRGIGRALLDALVQRGVRVVACARDEKRIADLAASARFLGKDAIFVEGDVRETQTAATLVAQAEENFGGVDLVVNNAGLINGPGNVEDLSTEQWRDVLDVNLMGAVFLCRAAVPSLRARGGGVILNMSSYWGHVGEAAFGPYCASKFAVEGLSQTLAAETKRDNIIVVAVRPGMVVTDMLDVATRGHAQGHKPAEQCAHQLVEVVENLTIADTGIPKDLR